MSCSQDNEGDFCPPENYGPRVRLVITCPTEHQHMINIPWLKGTMTAAGDMSYSFLPANCRWHSIEWLIEQTSSDTSTDGEGRETIIVDIDICIRVLDNNYPHVKDMLVAGISNYILQLVDPHQFCLNVSANFWGHSS